MAAQQPTVFTPVTFSNYSKRILLKTVFESGDGGLGFVDRKLVVGGWVKSSKEVIGDAVRPLVDASVKAAGDVLPLKAKDASCIEIVQSRIPIVRSLLRMLYGNHLHGGEKLETNVDQPPLPSTAFLVVNDGSCVADLQVVVESSLHQPIHLMPSGTCILVEGILKRIPVPGKHTVRLEVEKILHVGKVEKEKYPLSQKRIPMDVLRKFSYFRPRITTVASVMRIRNASTFATHTFFQNHSFLYVQLPTITTTDSEGFSEKFHVTTLATKLAGKKVEPTEDKETDGVSLETVKAAVMEKSNLVKELERSEGNKEALAAAVQDLKRTNELALQLEARGKSKPESSKDKVNVHENFFPQETYLTVSGQLHLETYACALGNVYSCGPRFRAGKIESAKHAAEMWMVEVEIAFAELEDAMNCADDLVKFLSKWVLDHCVDDMKFVEKRIDKTSIQRLESFISCSFEKVSYTAAIESLEKATPDQKHQHLKSLKFGAALTADHLSYLADTIYKKPVIVYNYPEGTKPFNVRLNDDGKTVAAFDVVLPKGGVVISGSQKEERLDVLMRRMGEMGLPREQYEWYLEIHRHGAVKHSGFSLAFDRFLLFTTGLTDIKDVIPFPRSFGKASD
ncbi:asparagine--tRNA ligase, cytoplasmic 2-like isoform X1 [Cucurbita pepo subsp. pepo]|uniref:asparagine--tRNA ligase, cytoplasmic 2-like isoform X1 n=1 Tax=Cucurbita pepo subsp. pepo TaxID=3664 RepID=UPI000C9D923B|nr:asparagine--tRNA ligase, cytoplasmic 2-like isoform X1 [Cucurbita pepo subsp. pepo]